MCLLLPLTLKNIMYFTDSVTGHYNFHVCPWKKKKCFANYTMLHRCKMYPNFWSFAMCTVNIMISLNSGFQLERRCILLLASLQWLHCVLYLTFRIVESVWIWGCQPCLDGKHFTASCLEQETVSPGERASMCVFPWVPGKGCPGPVAGIKWLHMTIPKDSWF